MEISDKTIAKQWMNKLEGAIIKKEYGLVGEIVENMKNYLHRFNERLNEEASLAGSPKDVLAIKLDQAEIRGDLRKYVSNLDVIIREIKFIYTEALNARQRIHQDFAHYPAAVTIDRVGVASNYYGRMVHNLGIEALVEFDKVIPSMDQYLDKKTSPTKLNGILD